MRYSLRDRGTIDAFEWTGAMDLSKEPKWIREALESGKAWFEDCTGNVVKTKKGLIFLVIKNNEGGDNGANPGDFITYDRNDIYIFSPDTFHKLYVLHRRTV
jgi:hypothetical protein